MIKFVMLLVFSALILPLLYMSFKRKKKLKDFVPLAAGAGVALIGMLIQSMYPFYIVLLFVLALSFITAIGVVKLRERTGKPLETKARKGKAEPKLAEPDFSNLPTSARTAPVAGMQAIEPIGREGFNE